MIQILGLRSFTDKATGETKRYDAFHDRNWRATDIFELFSNIQAHIKRIPPNELWNLFYTVASCKEGKRIFSHQEVIPLDIDGIVPGNEELVTQIVLEELKLSAEDVAVIFSGNGVHILIGLQNGFDDPKYFTTHKVYYKALCGRVNQALFSQGVAGKADPTCFSEARILRLPFTENRKEGKPNKQARIFKSSLKKLPITLEMLADLPMLGPDDALHPKVMDRFPDPERESIEEGCSFIRHCRDTREPYPEPHWYAMLSIVGRFPQGEHWAQEYSKPLGNRHPKYTYENTKQKLEHALESSGPRTCKNISEFHEGCKTCPHFGKISSPIQIISDKTIRTEATGFYNMIMDQKGNWKKGTPNYEDAMKAYERDHEYIAIHESQLLMIFNGKFWEEQTQLQIFNYADRLFDPSPNTAVCAEFESRLKRRNIVPMEALNCVGRINFSNGVLDIDTGVLTPHSSKEKFTYVIPYDYSPKGECPIFLKFLDDVSCDDPQIANLIAEYVGYCISGTDPELVQKCALMYGNGANGKSVLISLMREMVGNKNCSSMNLDALKRDISRYNLMNKMFNACAESPRKAFLESETFKALVGGDTVEVRRLYGQPIDWKCTTKMLFACNELPYSGDFSDGLYRRLMIIPFNATFSHKIGNADPLILQKLKTELSDIFLYCAKKFQECKDRGYKFSHADAVEEQMEDYKEQEDVVGRFVYNMCQYKEGTSLSTEEIFSLYAMWAKDNHQLVLPFPTFVRRLSKRLELRFPDVKKTRGGRGEGTSHRAVVYKNLIVKAVSTAAF